MLNCILCSEEFSSLAKFICHCRYTHKKTLEEMYIMMYGKSMCVNCGKETHYQNFTKGFKKSCGDKNCKSVAVNKGAILRAKNRWDGYLNKKKLIQPRPCLFCGNIFTPMQRDGAKYCSQSCGSNYRTFGTIENRLAAIKNKQMYKGNKELSHTTIKCPVTETILHITTRGNLLKKHIIDNKINHMWFFETYFPQFIIKCKFCGKNIQYKYNLLISGSEDPFCNKEHYTLHQIKYNHLYKMTDEMRQKQSEYMKELIKSGKFTPCVTNSWANSRIKIKIDDCVYEFRSTWECFFWLLNKHTYYEKIRIKYFDTKKNRKIEYILWIFLMKVKKYYMKSNQIL